MASLDTQTYHRMDEPIQPTREELAASGAYPSEQLPSGQLTPPIQAYGQPQPAPASPAPAVVHQPRMRQTFDVSKMDAGSLQTYSGLSGQHLSSDRLLGVVHTAGGQVVNHIDNTAAQLKDNITYDELLRTLIHENERILTKDWRLIYHKATFFDCETNHGLNPGSMPVIDSLPSGAAILTNKRLLLLSAQVHSGLTFGATGVDKATRGYTLTAYTSDNVHYKPLPLKEFCSIELCASAGARSTAQISPVQPCCGGICNCFGSCCAGAMKQWVYSLVSAENYNERTLKIGLHLPPWGRKCMLHMELDREMPLSLARDFIAMLQQHPKLAA